MTLYMLLHGRPAFLADSLGALHEAIRLEEVAWGPGMLPPAHGGASTGSAGSDDVSECGLALDAARTNSASDAGPGDLAADGPLAAACTGRAGPSCSACSCGASRAYASFIEAAAASTPEDAELQLAQAKDLVSQLLHKDVASRPTAAQARSHLWLRDVPSLGCPCLLQGDWDVKAVATGCTPSPDLESVSATECAGGGIVAAGVDSLIAAADDALLGDLPIALPPLPCGSPSLQWKPR